MDLAALIQSHGYWILAAACLLEGETVVALAGFAAHQGHLNLAAVVAVAATAGFAGDQFYFWLGRRHGEAVLARFPAVARETQRVQGQVDRWRGWLIVGLRFAYGLRIAGPILLGTTPMPAWRFALFNALGAALWAILFSGLGWAFGHAVEAAIGRAARIEAGLLAIVAIAAAAWLLRRRRRAARPHRDDGG